jgi:hypothetical protein
VWSDGVFPTLHRRPITTWEKCRWNKDMIGNEGQVSPGGWSCPRFCPRETETAPKLAHSIASLPEETPADGRFECAVSIRLTHSRFPIRIYVASPIDLVGPLRGNSRAIHISFICLRVWPDALISCSKWLFTRSYAINPLA